MPIRETSTRCRSTARRCSRRGCKGASAARSSPTSPTAATDELSFTAAEVDQPGARASSTLGLSRPGKATDSKSADEDLVLARPIPDAARVAAVVTELVTDATRATGEGGRIRVRL